MILLTLLKKSKQLKFEQVMTHKMEKNQFI